MYCHALSTSRQQIHLTVELPWFLEQYAVAGSIPVDRHGHLLDEDDHAVPLPVPSSRNMHVDRHGFFPELG
jgi:hypothetical protein